MKVVRVVNSCIDDSLDGATPQKIIRMMKDAIGRAKHHEKDRLRIQAYNEDYGHPFREPVVRHRIVVIDPVG